MIMAQSKRRARGFTLVELMIALVLGLIVTGAVLATFAANSRTYAASESLGRVQENARATFELMSRDIREAGGNICNSKLTPVNIVNDFATTPYTDFANGLSGTDVVAGGFQKDTLVLKAAIDGGLSIDADNSTNVNIDTDQDATTIKNGDIVLVCDPEAAAIFQVTNAPTVKGNIKIQTSHSDVPGNSTNCLMAGGDCGTGSLKRYAFGCQAGMFQNGNCKNGQTPAFISKLTSVSWFLANGTKNGISLYRRVDGKVPVTSEIAEGVLAMQLEYLVGTTYQTATTITAADSWKNVRAIRVVLTFEGEDRSAATGGTGQGLRRTVAYTVALRNRIND